MTDSNQGGTVAARQIGFLRRTFISLAQYRNYRLVWLGSCSEHLGEWMELAALLWLVHELSHSPLLLIVVGALRHLPLAHEGSPSYTHLGRGAICGSQKYQD